MTIKKDIDFFALVRETHEKHAEKSNIKPFFAPAAAIVLVLILWLVFSWLNIAAGQELSRVSSAISGNAGSAAPTGEQLGEWQAVEDFVHASLLFEQENALTTEAFKAVFAAQPEDLRVLSFKSEYIMDTQSQMITLDCESPRELCGADFARLLREIPNVSDVNYAGVTATEGGYAFIITLNLTGVKDKE